MDQALIENFKTNTMNIFATQFVFIIDKKL